MIYRCVKKRNQSITVKEAMRIRKANFAAESGLNLYELNTFPTTHV